MAPSQTRLVRGAVGRNCSWTTKPASGSAGGREVSRWTRRAVSSKSPSPGARRTRTYRPAPQPPAALREGELVVGPPRRSRRRREPERQTPPGRGQRSLLSFRHAHPSRQRPEGEVPLGGRLGVVPVNPRAGRRQEGLPRRLGERDEPRAPFAELDFAETRPRVAHRHLETQLLPRQQHRSILRPDQDQLRRQVGPVVGGQETSRGHRLEAVVGEVPLMDHQVPLRLATPILEPEIVGLPTKDRDRPGPIRFRLGPGIQHQAAIEPETSPAIALDHQGAVGVGAAPSRQVQTGQPSAANRVGTSGLGVIPSGQ